MVKPCFLPITTTQRKDAHYQESKKMKKHTELLKEANKLENSLWSKLQQDLYLPKS